MTALSKQHQALGRNIRILREENGLTLEDLAHEVEIDASFLAYIERGERNVTTDKLFRLAGALRIETAELLRDV